MKYFNFKLNKGFTLIELLVVISIITLLSSVVLASTQNVKAKARDSQRIQAVHQMDLAIKLYANDHNGDVPKFVACGDTVLPCTAFSSGGQNWTSFTNALVPTYIKTLPSSLNNIDYVYVGPTDSGDQSSYQISAPLENVPGTQTGYSTTGTLLSVIDISGVDIKSFSGPTSLLNKTSGTWDVTVTNPKSVSVTYTIDWGDGNTNTVVSNSTNFSVSHTYNRLGNFTISPLIVGQDSFIGRAYFVNVYLPPF